MEDWKSQLEKEFAQAEAARERGNEGQARVCARRAAGIAIREYLQRRGQAVRTTSAYDLLNLLLQDRGLASEARQAAVRLTMRVDENFQLPGDVDLLVESRSLCDHLLSK